MLRKWLEFYFIRYRFCCHSLPISDNPQSTYRQFKIIDSFYLQSSFPSLLNSSSFLFYPQTYPNTKIFSSFFIIPIYYLTLVQIFAGHVTFLRQVWYFSNWERKDVFLGGIFWWTIQPVLSYCSWRGSDCWWRLAPSFWVCRWIRLIGWSLWFWWFVWNAELWSIVNLLGKYCHDYSDWWPNWHW